MLVQRSQIVDFITKESKQFIINDKASEKLYDYIFDTYNINRGITADVICGRRDLISLTDFFMYTLVDGIDTINGTQHVKKFFVDSEINEYSQQKYQPEKIDFPLIFDAIQISNDQWMTSVSVQELMKFKSEQIINYNTNTQRAMTRITRNGEEAFAITINMNAVKAIKDGMHNGTYISDALTFNIPLDDDCSFKFDAENRKLIIYNLDHFDILDGYHRYLAMGEEWIDNNDFDLIMELRITNWDESKAKQFIFQKDQKTKMRKVDSLAMNQNDVSNRVVEKLNTKSNFDFQGCIGRNDAQINQGDLVTIIRYFYFKEATKTTQINKKIIDVANDIAMKMNSFVESEGKLLEIKYGFTELLTLFTIFRDSTEDKYPVLSENFISIVNEIDNREHIRLLRRNPSKRIIDQITNILLEYN